MLDKALEHFNDIEVGVNFIKTLNIAEEDMAFPTNEMKVREVAEYLNEHPEPDFIIGLTKNNRSPNMNNLDFLTGYVKLNKKRDELERALARVVRDIKFYEGTL